MKWNRLSLLTIGFVLGSAGGGRAQVGGVYNLSWNTMDVGGATTVTGGVYSLGGTIGQPDAGVQSGGSYVLASGFWPGLFNPATDVLPADPAAAAPDALAFLPPSPNPFGHETRLAFDLPRAGQASARIYGASGELVRTLVDGALPAGRHEVVWPGTNDAGRRVAQGIYVARLEAGSEVQTRKLVLTR